jgi:hypothetical protein
VAMPVLSIIASPMRVCITEPETEAKDNANKVVGDIVNNDAIDDAPYVRCCSGALAEAEGLFDVSELVMEVRNFESSFDVEFAFAPCAAKHSGD